MAWSVAIAFAPPMAIQMATHRLAAPRLLHPEAVRLQRASRSRAGRGRACWRSWHLGGSSAGPCCIRPPGASAARLWSGPGSSSAITRPSWNSGRVSAAPAACPWQRSGCGSAEIRTASSPARPPGSAGCTPSWNGSGAATATTASRTSTPPMGSSGATSGSARSACATATESSWAPPSREPPPPCATGTPPAPWSGCCGPPAWPPWWVPLFWWRPYSGPARLRAAPGSVSTAALSRSFRPISAASMPARVRPPPCPAWPTTPATYAWP